MDLLASLDFPIVAPKCKHGIIYAHPGWPHAVDGPNELSHTEKLLFIGQSAIASSIDGDKGGAARIDSNLLRHPPCK